jgi:hypothetical protein
MRIALAGTGAFGIKHLDGLQNIDGVCRTFFPRKNANQGLTSKTAKLYIRKPILHG